MQIVLFWCKLWHLHFTIYAVLSQMTFLSRNTRFNSRHFWVCYQALNTFNDVWWAQGGVQRYGVNASPPGKGWGRRGWLRPGGDHAKHGFLGPPGRKEKLGRESPAKQYHIIMLNPIKDVDSPSRPALGWTAWFFPGQRKPNCRQPAIIWLLNASWGSSRFEWFIYHHWWFSNVHQWIWKDSPPLSAPPSQSLCNVDQAWTVLLYQHQETEELVQ